MIFAVPSDPESTGLYGRETEADGFAECGGIDVWNAILVADPAIGEIEPLARNIPVRIRSVIGSQPETKQSIRVDDVAETSSAPSLDKYLLRPVAGRRGGSSADIGGQFLKSLIVAQSHPSKSTSGVQGFLIWGHSMRCPGEHSVVLGPRIAQEHGHVIRLTG